MKKIYLIAGEPSGDLLGGHLMNGLQGFAPKFYGIGGIHMEKQGLVSFFPMKELSVMGLFEIIPRVRQICARLDQTINHILDIKPDLLITIDSPGYCFRVVKSLKKHKISFPCIHYVAPSVWAWRPRRAKKISNLFDHLMCLFPFEPPYFTPHGLLSSFVGHPIVDMPPKLLKKENIALILPGSRVQEIKAHLSVFLEAFSLWNQSLTPVILTLPHLVPVVQHISKNSTMAITTDRSIFEKASIALATSGTVSLELASFQIPMVTAYRLPCLTYQILSRVVKTKYINLVNILMNELIVPELIQSQCTPEKLAKSLLGVNCNPGPQLNAFDRVKTILRSAEHTTSIIAKYL